MHGISTFFTANRKNGCKLTIYSANVLHVQMYIVQAALQTWQEYHRFPLEDRLLQCSAPSRFRKKVVQCPLFYITGSVNQIAVQSTCKSLIIIGQLLRTLNANLARRSLSIFFAFFLHFLRRTQMQLSWHSLENRENFHLFFLF